MTGQQRIITPGQGLLLLIKHYQHDPIKLQTYKSLYLNGANTTDNLLEMCNALLDNPVMTNVELIIDESSINGDPTRRYFETHLAYQSLKHQLHAITIAELASLYETILTILAPHIPSNKLITIHQVLNGMLIRPTFQKRENYEFNFYIKKIIHGSIFSEFSKIDREKILYLVKIIYLSLAHGWCDTKLPMDIYHSGRFSPSARGRVMRDMEDLRSMRNQHFGLLKGHMPLAMNDIARADTPFEHVKPGDYSTFNVDSPTIQECFNQLVHPFSNSISGSFLLLLRVLGYVYTQKSGTDFTPSLDKFILLIRLCISSSLYYSGGHSLYEYIAIIKTPEVQHFFEFIPEFSQLDLAKLFYDKNENAFDEALKDTLEYYEHLTARQSTHLELFSLFNNHRQKAQSIFKTASLKRDSNI